MKHSRHRVGGRQILTSADERYVVTMVELEAEICWRLVARSAIGRVAFINAGSPMVLPVNVGIHDGTIVYRTARHAMLQRIGDGSEVAFEADNIDIAAESGWSVVVRGHAHEITDRAEAARLAELAVHPWAAGERDTWVRILPFEISGRAISRRRPPGEMRYPYMQPD